MKILFDVDGTLLDSMHIWIEPMDRIFKKYDFDFTGLSHEEKGVIESLPFEATCQYIADNIATDMTARDVREYFDEIIDEAYRNTLMPKDGALAKLEELADAGYEMAIASSTDSMYLKLAFERLNIDKYFSFYNTPDITKQKKSDPEYWQYAIDKFGVDPSDIILFDDALYAIKAAKSQGIKTCGLKDYPYNENEWDAIVENADYVLDSIADIDVNNL